MKLRINKPALIIKYADCFYFAGVKISGIYMYDFFMAPNDMWPATQIIISINKDSKTLRANKFYTLHPIFLRQLFTVE